MKKIISAIIATAVMLSLCLSVSASGINSNEQAVLELLKTKRQLGTSSRQFSLPDEYINAAENFFNTIDMDQAQRDLIVANIEEGMDIIVAQAEGFSGTTYDLKLMDSASKTRLLALGQEACAAVDANLTFDASEGKVVISNTDGTVIFTNAPVIKTTGQEHPVTAAAVGVTVAVIVICGAALLFAVSKKKGLLVR